ncbi:MAG: class I SAM-dependent methyltransferase [Gammaproteobacteria bacterium]|jgi:SAM-dependent methyltransferase|nr:class I SAM-dependent methyltransferase [Gammaproteobacteria bacterium]
MSTKSASKHQTMADKADIHELYELSVQNVEHEIEFLQATFKSLTGRTAYMFREDFCGTASASCQWVRQGSNFQAIGVDIEPSVLEWGRLNRIAKLDPENQARVSLIEADVLTVETPKVDLLAAFNFSFFIFDTRNSLRAYFEKAHAALKDDGVFFCDMFGGPEAQEETKEKTKHEEHGFSYIWHQAKFHPVTNFIRCHIHFHFKDGSKIKEAFTYEWRLWSAPEIKELLLEAGFSKATIYWEGEDEDGEGNGEFTPDEKGEADLAWIAYVVAEK